MRHSFPKKNAQNEKYFQMVATQTELEEAGGSTVPLLSVNLSEAFKLTCLQVCSGTGPLRTFRIFRSFTETILFTETPMSLLASSVASSVESLSPSWLVEKSRSAFPGNSARHHDAIIGTLRVFAFDKNVNGSSNWLCADHHR